MTERAYFVIADITGYTAFLTGSELDHAQDILKSLFDTLLDKIKPPLLISNFQGDAILSYLPEAQLGRGENLLEMVEAIYIAFTRKLELMQVNTTCTCKACANMSLLDLKLFVHYGEYLLQDMRGKAELSGRDVIIAHRMMKNRVKEETGMKAYTLFTQAAIQQLGLQDFTCEMKPYTDSYEHIGELKMYAYCLKTMWEKRRDQHRHIVKPEQALFVVSREISASPAQLWLWLTDPQARLESAEAEKFTVSNLQNGRIGQDTTYHCYHGSGITQFLILDWQPFEYFTERISGLPLGIQGTLTTHLEETAQGVKLSLIGFLAGQSFFSQLATKLVQPIFRRALIKDYNKLLDHLSLKAQRI